MKKISIIISLLVLCQLALSAQSHAKKSKFSIGDSLPEFTLRNLINYPKQEAKISGFKGKTVILYFWNEGCTSSIHNWPKLLELQQLFDKNIRIILVNESQDQSTVRRILNDQKKVAHVDMTLPIVCLDKELNTLFPRNSIPHLVWIDPSGKLAAITSGDQLSEANLKALSEGRAVSMMQKDGIRYKVDFSKPLFVRSNGGDGDHLQWQSVLSEYFPGLTAEAWVDSCGGTLSNATLVTMIRELYKNETNRFGALNLLPVSRVSLNVKDTTQYMVRVNGELQYKNFYTYQLYSKKSKNPMTIRSMMLEDLKRYFEVDWYWTRQKKTCLVLTADDTSKFRYRAGETMLAVRPTDIEMNNVTFKELLENLLAVTDYHNSPYPLIDETGFKGKVGDIKLAAKVEDPKELDRALNEYGLHLTFQQREVNVLVIYEPDYYTPKHLDKRKDY